MNFDCLKQTDGKFHVQPVTENLVNMCSRPD